MTDPLYIRQKRMNCSLATLQMAADRFGISPVESTKLFATHRHGLSLYSPGDLCLLFQRMGINAFLLESPAFEDIDLSNQFAIAISFLVPTGHYLLVEKILPNNQLLVSDPLGCYPYGRGGKDGHNQVYDFEVAIAPHTGMPYWFICFGKAGDIPELSCGYAVSDIALKNKSLVIKNGDINYLSREVNTTLNLDPWQGWKLETIKALVELCNRHNVNYNNQVDGRVANLIIREFTAKWRRLNSTRVK